MVQYDGKIRVMPPRWVPLARMINAGLVVGGRAHWCDVRTGRHLSGADHAVIIRMQHRGWLGRTGPNDRLVLLAPARAALLLGPVGTLTGSQVRLIRAIAAHTLGAAAPDSRPLEAMVERKLVAYTGAGLALTAWGDMAVQAIWLMDTWAEESHPPGVDRLGVSG